MKYIWKDTFKSIRKSLSKFITLTCIVTLGVSFFVGLQAAPGSMANSIETMDDALNLHDYQIISTLGFEQEDIRQLQENDYIEEVQPYYFLDCYTKRGKSVQVYRLEGKSKGSIDRYEIVEGRDIQSKNEMIILDPGDVTKQALGKSNSSYPKIGETITVYLDSSEITDVLNRVEFEVVGYYRDSKYITKMLDTSTLDAQMLSNVAIIDASNFIMDAIPSVMITLKNASDLNSFSKDYQDYIDTTTLLLDETFKQGEQNRNDAVIGKANEELAKAKQDYEEGLNTFNTEIKDAQSKINEGQGELTQAYTDLIQGEKDYSTQKKEAFDKLRDSETQVLQGKEELSRQEALFEEQKALALQQLDAAKQELNNKQLQLEQAKQLIKVSTESIIPGFYDNYIYPASQPLISIGYQEASNGNTDPSLIASMYPNEVNALVGAVMAGIWDSDILDKPIDTATQSIIARDLIVAYVDAQLLQDSSFVAQLNTLYPQLEGDSVQQLQQYRQDYPDEYRNHVIHIALASQNELQQILDVNQIPINIEELKISMATLAISEGMLNYGKQAYDRAYQEAMEQLAHGEELLRQAKAQLIAASEQIIEGWDQAHQQLAQAQETIDDGWQQYHQGLQEINNAKEELNTAICEGQEELDDAALKIEDAEKEINDIEPCEWIVLDRGSHYSSVMYHNTISTMKGIGALFPLFFILVAILVCLTTMTRMVEEERILIGTYRSLGFSRLQSCAKFLIYALLASFVGCVLGSIIGLIVFPVIIYNAWGMMYLNPEFTLVIPWGTLLLISLMFIGLMVATTYYTCRTNMNEVPAQLMRPHAPNNAKKTIIERIGFIWDKLNFTMKVTVRNLFRYKKRFFMTVIGVGGCTSLMVCGFGIKDSVSAIGTVQYGQLYRFDGSVSFDNLDSVAFDKKLDDYSNLENVTSAYPIYFTNITVKGDIDQSSYLYVIDQKDVSSVFDLHDYKTKQPIELSDNGVVISKRLAQYYDLNVGDSIMLYNNNKQKESFVIDGICEMYIYHHIFMTKAAYEATFGQSVADNTIAFSTNDQALMTQYIQQDSDVTGYNFATTVISFVNNLIEGFGIIMIVLVSSAAALAFVVLGNLTSVNLSERLREIATLKVLGFTKKEVHHYVYYENIILTMIGGIVGLFLGKLEITMIMSMIQMDNIAFSADVKLVSYFISYILTIVFAMLVNLLMQRKLDQIDMVESLKSIE